MKTIIFCLFSIGCTFATTYNVVNSNGAYTYTTPSLASPASNLANPAFQNNEPPNNTNVAGQLAGAVAASAAARATNNPAAEMGAQNMLVNAGATAISTGVLGAVGAIMAH